MLCVYMVNRFITILLTTMLHVLLLQSKPSAPLHFYLFLLQHQRYTWGFRRNNLEMTDCNFYQEVSIAFLHSDILNVKTKTASHQESQAGDQRHQQGGEEVRDRRQGDGSREEGFVVGNPLLSFLLFILSSSLWLSASLPCIALSNLSRKQVRQADDETSDCMRGCGGGGNAGRRKVRYKASTKPD